MKLKILNTELLKHISENYSYDPDSGLLYYNGIKTGSLSSSGYLYCTILNENLSVHRVCWYLYYNEFPNHSIDHVDRVKTNNKIINLRKCNQAQNLANRTKMKPGTSSFKGVYFIKKQNKYCARISFNNKRIYLGLFNNELDAAEVYNKKAKELYGDFAINDITL